MPSAETPHGEAASSERIPVIYRISRVLALVVCLPAALALGAGLALEGDIVVAIVENKAITTSKVRGRTQYRHTLHTLRGKVDVSKSFYEQAASGDTLHLQRGPFQLGTLDITQRVELIQGRQVVQDEHPAYKFVGVMVLVLLLPLLGYRPYKKWKCNQRMKVVMVMIPFSTLAILLIMLFA